MRWQNQRMAHGTAAAKWGAQADAALLQVQLAQAGGAPAAGRRARTVMPSRQPIATPTAAPRKVAAL